MPAPAERDLDSDCDGIADVDDACPAEAEDRDGFQDDDGCPDHDDDGDGVPDVCDRCPREPGDDGQGCPRPKAVVVTDSSIRIIEYPRFAFGSATPLPRAIPIIDAAAAVLRDNPRIRRIAIVGHATPDEPRPEALSKRRAESVARLLVAHGVSPERLEARGVGAAKPLVPNTNAEERAKNRRVEFLVLETNAPAAPVPMTPRHIDRDPPCMPPAPTRPIAPCHVARVPPE